MNNSTKPVKKSFRKALTKFSKKSLDENLQYKNKQIKNDIATLESNLESALHSAGVPTFALTPAKIQLSDIEDERMSLSKESYSVPYAQNIGTLVSKKTFPSEIMKDNSFSQDLPLLIPTKNSGVAFLINPKYKDEIIAKLEAIVINSILSLPDGLVEVTLIDKTGSGQNFKALNTLSAKFVKGKVLSEDREIETALGEIKNSMGATSKAISSNGFDSVEQYNRDTDETPQRYTFIVINDFPSGFNKKSTENLFALVESGSKSGVFVFMTSQFDKLAQYTQNINGLTLDSFVSLMTTIQYSNRSHAFLKEGIIDRNVEITRVPLVKDDAYKSLVNSTYKIKLREESVKELREKVSYLNRMIEPISLKPMILLESIIPPKELWYKGDASRGISVPFGKIGIEDMHLDLGVNRQGETENVHHTLIAGMTGSGKTVLIHDIIVMASILYSPEELQFFLLDYKEGTEFAMYKNFPQVKILSMGSEIDFGHDVLQHAIDIISQRGLLFKELNVSNLKGYNTKIREYNANLKPGEKKKDILPRIIIWIDEFQELFPSNIRISSKTNELFDNILRRGRSFGINLSLATQTLMGVDLDQSILSNIPLRIGLRMEFKDATKIFGDENEDAKYLPENDPGQGIYNSAHGLSKHNQPFQACNIEDVRLEGLLNEIHDFMKDNISKESYEKITDERFIYFGDKPGSLKTMIDTDIIEYNNNKGKRFFIGQSIGLEKEHKSITFSNDFGSNLLMVGSNVNQAISTVLTLLEQLNKKDRDIYFCNFSLKFKKLFEKELDSLEKVKQGNNIDSEEYIQEIYDTYSHRKSNQLLHEKPIDLIFFVIESSAVLNTRSSKVRDKLMELIGFASEYGIHVTLFAIDYTTLRDQDLIQTLSKFKRKIAFRGGNSEKIFDSAENIKASKNKKLAYYEVEQISPTLFKPYVNEKVEKLLKELK